LLKELVDRLPKGARVLDAGCGSGVPVTRYLARFLMSQVWIFPRSKSSWPRRLVSKARFICEDMTDLAFPDESFDAICSYYAIFHVPRTEHRRILQNFSRMLKPKGLALLCMGAEELEETADFHGTPMYWSHYGSEKNLRLLKECRYDILWSKIVKDAIYQRSAHLFVLAGKR